VEWERAVNVAGTAFVEPSPDKLTSPTFQAWLAAGMPVPHERALEGGVGVGDVWFDPVRNASRAPKQVYESLFGAPLSQQNPLARWEVAANALGIELGSQTELSVATHFLPVDCTMQPRTLSFDPLPRPTFLALYACIISGK
jgi:3-methyladenine DNA glycosylase/8-oxoguanine DNA glycosylase